MTIALAQSVGAFFKEAVAEAVQTRHVKTTEEASHYLVSLLTDLARPQRALDEAFDRPLAFLLNDALHTTGPERFQRLRTLGDGALVLTGLFGDHIENRGVDATYVANMGAGAYSAAAVMFQARQRRSHADNVDVDHNVFGELSRKFAQFVRVLTAIADHTLVRQARGERGVLRLYERWLRSGSDTLAAELTARGLVPVRGHGGVH